MPASTPDGGRRRGLHGRGDLPPIPLLRVSDEQWANRAEAVAMLRAWAEQRTTETITWYLRDKQAKRWASRLLRAAAVVAAVAGGVLPLISGTVNGINPNLGYVLLAVAAGCVAFDHFFGLSSGWMRDMASIQVLQSKLTRFELDWARWQASRVSVAANRAVAEGETLNAALELIEALVTGVSQVTEAETTQWIADFSSSVAALRQQANPGLTSPQDLLTWGSQGELSTG